MFSNEVEFHFFFVCPAYDTVRELYFKPEWNNTVITVQKVHNIMSSKAKQDILSIAKFLLSTFFFTSSMYLYMTLLLLYCSVYVLWVGGLLLQNKIIVLYCIVLYCIVLYCIVLYCIVLYCIVLYCIVLYCICRLETSPF